MKDAENDVPAAEYGPPEAVPRRIEYPVAPAGAVQLRTIALSEIADAVKADGGSRFAVSDVKARLFPRNGSGMLPVAWKSTE